MTSLMPDPHPFYQLGVGDPYCGQCDLPKLNRVHSKRRYLVTYALTVEAFDEDEAMSLADGDGGLWQATEQPD